MGTSIVQSFSRLLLGWVSGDIKFPPPMGLHEHAVDLFQIDGAGLITHSLDEG